MTTFKDLKAGQQFLSGKHRRSAVFVKLIDNERNAINSDGTLVHFSANDLVRPMPNSLKVAQALLDVLDGQQGDDIHRMTGLPQEWCAEIAKLWVEIDRTLCE